MSKKPIYILGTATSHDGSACLLKDGKIIVAIEKERITRNKHDGGNDTAAINYCLDAAGITLEDLSLVVQNDNFGDYRFGNTTYKKEARPFPENPPFPIVTISHHLAHAYSVIGTCPFDEFNILIVDGCGSPYDQCIDLDCLIPDRNKIEIVPHLFCEKDSYYQYKDGRCTTLYKDFSEHGYLHRYPIYPEVTKHSIGGIYSGVSVYCFGDLSDPGKLMGLAPFGRPGEIEETIFELRDSRVFANYDWMLRYQQPAKNYVDFNRRFQHYADLAYNTQKELERALLYLVRERLDFAPCKNLGYAGGVALNAVANARILKETNIDNIYMEPAAGDNGLSLGCAFYGWLEVLKKERVKHDGNTCFGRSYSEPEIQQTLQQHHADLAPEKMEQVFDLFFEELNRDKNENSLVNAIIQFNIEGSGVYQLLADKQLTCVKGILGKPASTFEIAAKDMYEIIFYPQYLEQYYQSGKIRISDLKLVKKVFSNYNFYQIAKKMPDLGSRSQLHFYHSEEVAAETARLLAEGKIVGWFQGGSEFGPRALGRRSILADPRNSEARDFINLHVKFREDFRPFAPSVLREDVSTYFQTDRESPYMILVDPVRPEWKEKISSVVHENNTCRIQTVTEDWNPKYYRLLQEFKKVAGISLLLNTSFNRKGMPIVETPKEALDFFFECALDYLVLGDYIVSKEPLPQKLSVTADSAIVNITI